MSSLNPNVVALTKVQFLCLCKTSCELTIGLSQQGATLFTIQLGLNLIWMPLFFRFKRPIEATADIIALTGVTGYLTYIWSYVRRFRSPWFLELQYIFREQSSLPTPGACFIDLGSLPWISNADSESCVGRSNRCMGSCPISGVVGICYIPERWHRLPQRLGLLRQRNRCTHRPGHRS